MFCDSFNSDILAVSEAVIYSIRKNYIHISWKGGGGWNVDLPCITLPPRKKQGQQQFCNIITIVTLPQHHSEGKGKCGRRFPRVSSKSGGGEKKRSVVCQTCQPGSFQSKEMSCASALLATPWGACGCCCGGSCGCCCWGGCCCCCCCGPPGGATL